MQRVCKNHETFKEEKRESNAENEENRKLAKSAKEDRKLMEHCTKKNRFETPIPPSLRNFRKKKEANTELRKINAFKNQPWYLFDISQTKIKKNKIKIGKETKNEENLKSTKSKRHLRNPTYLFATSGKERRKKMNVNVQGTPGNSSKYFHRRTNGARTVTNNDRDEEEEGVRDRVPRSRRKGWTRGLTKETPTFFSRSWPRISPMVSLNRSHVYRSSDRAKRQRGEKQGGRNEGV